MDTHDHDIVAWSEQQAALLRRLASGEVLGGNEIDWHNIIDEIESVGSNEVHAVESLLIQAMRHWLKIQAWPHSEACAHWQAEANVAIDTARRRYVRSMAQKLDVDALYGIARRGVAATDWWGRPPETPLPENCPWTREELLP